MRIDFFLDLTKIKICNEECILPFSYMHFLFGYFGDCMVCLLRNWVYTCKRLWIPIVAMMICAGGMEDLILNESQK